MCGADETGDQDGGPGRYLGDRFLGLGEDGLGPLVLGADQHGDAAFLAVDDPVFLDACQPVIAAFVVVVLVGDQGADGSSGRFSLERRSLY